MLAFKIGASKKTVLVFGDSWGDTGPTYHEVQDTLDRHAFPAIVRSAAVGGTTACGWAAQDNGTALVQKARSLFPDAHDGPDYLWYTLGGNDIAFDKPMRACAKEAKTFEDMTECVHAASARAKKCTESLLDNFWKEFPKSHVMQSGYDLPCENWWCDLTMTGSYDAGWCGSNNTCLNSLIERFHHFYVGELSQKYAQQPYAGLNILGTAQKAGGIPGADVGHPDLTQGSPCQWETLCVHPKYGTPAATAVGEAFWSLYFSKQSEGALIV